MRQKTERHQGAADRTIKDIRRRTRKRYSSEEKIRIVLAGLRGEDSITRKALVILLERMNHLKDAVITQSQR